MDKPLQSYKGKLGIHRAAHLLRRTSYNLSIERINQFAKMKPKEALEVLFTPYNPKFKEPIDPKNKLPFIDLHRGKRRRYARAGGSTPRRQSRIVLGWWIDNARKDPSIHSKLAFFYHQNFAVHYHIHKIGPQEFFDYLNLLKDHVLKTYKGLAYEIVVNNLMLEYLDNYTNSKDNPNENFAREFFELFTIGKGRQVGAGDYTTYTEDDVRTAARLLTGFVKGPKNLNFKKSVQDKIIMKGPNRGDVDITIHDTSNKVFSQAFGKRRIKGAKSETDMWRELQDFVDMIFEQKATAQNICRKIYRFFVNAHIDEAIEKNIINPLAKVLQERDYKIRPVMRILLMSRHFLGDSESEHSIVHAGSLIKSPLELTLPTLSFFNVAVPHPVHDARNHYVYWFVKGMMENVYRDSMGFVPFSPQDVAGYPPFYQEPKYDKGWINSTSIVGRYQFIVKLLRPKLEEPDFGLVQLDVTDFVKKNISDPKEASEIVKTLILYLFPLPVNENRYNYFLNTIFLDGYSEKTWYYEWKKYEKSNNPSAVKPSLERLLVAIANAPEFQVM